MEPIDSVDEIVETGITRRTVTRRSYIIQEVSIWQHRMTSN